MLRTLLPQVGRGPLLPPNKRDQISHNPLEEQSQNKNRLTKRLQHMTLNPALKSQRQVNLSECKASLDYIVSSITARASPRNPISKQQHPPKRTKTNMKKNTDVLVMGRTSPLTLAAQICITSFQDQGNVLRYSLDFVFPLPNVSTFSKSSFL